LPFTVGNYIPWRRWESSTIWTHNKTSRKLVGVIDGMTITKLFL